MTRTTPRQQHVLELLRADGAIRTRDHPDLRACVRSMSERGALCQALPGIQVPAASAASFTTRLAALRKSDPGAVVAGTAAARLAGWQLRDDTVAAYRSGGTRASRP